RRAIWPRRPVERVLHHARHAVAVFRGHQDETVTVGDRLPQRPHRVWWGLCVLILVVERHVVERVEYQLSSGHQRLLQCTQNNRTEGVSAQAAGDAEEARFGHFEYSVQERITSRSRVRSRRRELEFGCEMQCDLVAQYRQSIV